MIPRVSSSQIVHDERMSNFFRPTANADTFEAFVGAVAQVHGQEVLTKWIEDLIRPYATQMYDHFARTLGEDEGAEVASVPSSLEDGPPKYKKRYRFCGFLPIPFLFASPETKSIAGPSSGQAHNYGTLVSVSQAASGQYQRLPDSVPAAQAETSKSSSAMKKTKSHDASAKPQGAGPTVGILKNSKSRERLAFTPPSVSNMESLQAAKKKKMSSLSDGEQPRNAAVLQSPRKGQGQQNGKSSHSIVKIQPPANAQASQPPVKVQAHHVPQNPTANNVTKANVPAPASSAGVAPPATKPDAAKDSEAAWQAAWDSVPTLTTPRKFLETSKPATQAAPTVTIDTPSKHILKRDEKVTAASLSTAASSPAPATNGTSPASQKVSLNSASSTYLAALQEARIDPVGVLERHPMFHGKKSKQVEYDDVGSTQNKAIVRVKIDGKAITQGSAAGSDGNLAKQRAAFKAIETLMVILMRYLKLPSLMLVSLDTAPARMSSRVG